jgi:hypothetical protein
VLMQKDRKRRKVKTISDGGEVMEMDGERGTRRARQSVVSRRSDVQSEKQRAIVKPGLLRKRMWIRKMMKMQMQQK